MMRKKGKAEHSLHSGDGVHDTPNRIAFPAVGTRFPTDHGYPLYSSISRLLPACTIAASLSLPPITGQHVGNGLIALDSSRLRLRLRLASADLPSRCAARRKTLNLLGHRLTLGVPQVFRPGWPRTSKPVR